jgi:hypothetical protein
VPRNLTRPESQTCRHGWSPRDSGPPVQSGSPRILGMRPHDHATAARIVFATGAWWVHLRLCLTYGHVGCCDESPNRHATAHFHQTGHPVIRSFEPGESWIWCFVDELDFEDA